MATSEDQGSRDLNLLYGREPFGLLQNAKGEAKLIHRTLFQHCRKKKKLIFPQSSATGQIGPPSRNGEQESVEHALEPLDARSYAGAPRDVSGKICFGRRS